MENKKGIIKSALTNLLIVATSVAYLFFGMLNFDKTDKSLEKTLVTSIIGVVCAILIKRAMGENGIDLGYKSEKYIDELEKYNEVCKMANPYLDKIDNYYASEEIRKLKEYRRINLNAVRLRYCDWFNEDGEYIENKERYKKLKLRQKWVMFKCLHAKMRRLSLMSEYEDGVSSYTKGEITAIRYRGQRTFKNTLTALAPIFVIGYFTITFKTWNWGKFIGCLIQVLMWVLTGLLELYNAYQYVTDTKVSYLRKKKEEIIKFTKGCEEGQYKENPYIELELKQRSENYGEQIEQIND